MSTSMGVRILTKNANGEIYSDVVNTIDDHPLLRNTRAAANLLCARDIQGALFIKEPTDYHPWYYEYYAQNKSLSTMDSQDNYPFEAYGITWHNVVELRRAIESNSKAMEIVGPEFIAELDELIETDPETILQFWFTS